MTYSIIAHDEKTGQVGIAVASKTFAAGASVPFIKTGVGAIASQAKGNQLYGPRGLALRAACAARPPPMHGACRATRRGGSFPGATDDGFVL